MGERMGERMGDPEQEQQRSLEETVRRAREEMHAATASLRALLHELRGGGGGGDGDGDGDGDEPPPRGARSPGSAPSR